MWFYVWGVRGLGGALSGEGDSVRISRGVDRYVGVDVVYEYKTRGFVVCSVFSFDVSVVIPVVGVFLPKN